MRTVIAFSVIVFLAAGCSSAGDHPHAGPPATTPGRTPPPAATAPAPKDENLPASEETAKSALEKSSRHGESVDVKLPGGGAPIRTWVVYPERKDKAGVVIVIHEIYGLTDWIRGVADQFAREGFIAVAPDLISGLGPGGGGTESAASRDDVVKLVRGLSNADTYARLNAVRDYAVKLPAANGKTATIGFCGGGARGASVTPRRSPPSMRRSCITGLHRRQGSSGPSRRPSSGSMAATTRGSTRRFPPPRRR